MSASITAHHQSDRTKFPVRVVVLALLMVICALGLSTAAAAKASAHVVPTSSLQLDIEQDHINAVLLIPLTDVDSATGIDLADQTQSAVTTNAAAIRQYLRSHFTPSTDSGQAWTVGIGSLAVDQAGNAATTGLYQQLRTTVTLSPPAGSADRSFNLGYDAIVDKVATHVVIVTVTSDWRRPGLSPYQIGTVKRDTVTNTVQPLHIDVGTGSTYRGFLSMVALGMQHIEEGTDHQLFLLALLLPAPLLASRRRWGTPVTPRQAVRRIATITMAFTLGHSVTLALGVLGLPVPQKTIEAAIAVSILVAAVHAIRPLFPGREAFVAASFGLVHGLAFSETLRQLNLTGSQLVLSLLGFNVGLEAMQLIVVTVVLPPLIMLARAERYRTLRIVAAAATAVAALGWLGQRIGIANPVADLADQLGVISVPIAIALWIGAISVTVARHRAKPRPSQPPMSPSDRVAGASTKR